MVTRPTALAPVARALRPAAEGPSSPPRRRLLQAAAAAPLLPVLAACDGSWSPDRGTDYRDTIADGRAAILQAMSATRTSSVSVALLDAGHVVWQEAFGVIDRESQTPASAETLYNIGSCSKVFAATAVMILVDRGRIELDAPVTRYIPAFRMLDPAYTAITVRMLLSHSSGLPGTTARNIFMFRPWDGYAQSVQDTLAGLRLKAAPGEFSVYCNDGFTMAERVVTEVAGMPYPEFVRREILEPLGMRRSRYPTEAFPEGSFAHSYLGDARQGQEFVLAYGTGGPSSTPGDMLRFAAMFVGGGQLDGRRILSEAAVREMATDQVEGQPLNPFDQLRFGLGWDSVRQIGMEEVGVACWQKNGGTALYSSDFFVLPREEMALMITGTSGAYGAGALAERILLHALAERRTIERVPPRITAASTAPQPADDALASAMVGVYGSHEGLYRLERGAGTSLVLQRWHNESATWEVLAGNLQRQADGFFTDASQPLEGWRLASHAGLEWLTRRVPTNYGHYLVEMPHAQRLSARPALSAAWRARLGRRWLLVNEDWASVGTVMGDPDFTLAECPELPGHVLLDGSQAAAPDGDSRTRMVLQIPLNSGRDLQEAVLHPRPDGEWLWVSGQWFRPLDTVGALARGSHVVTLGEDGFTEWRRVPGGSRVRLQGSQSAWRLYRADGAAMPTVASGESDGHIDVPAGDHLLGIYGQAGATASVVVV